MFLSTYILWNNTSTFESTKPAWKFTQISEDKSQSQASNRMYNHQSSSACQRTSPAHQSRWKKNKRKIFQAVLQDLFRARWIETKWSSKILDWTVVQSGNISVLSFHGPISWINSENMSKIVNILKRIPWNHWISLKSTSVLHITNVSESRIWLSLEFRIQSVDFSNVVKANVLGTQCRPAAKG